MASQYKFLCFAVLVLAHLSAFAQSSPSVYNEITSGERELRKDLFRYYDKNTRPVEKYTNAVPVSVSMTPLSLNDLNEYTRVMSLDTWILMLWKDDYLKWNPEEYDGITALHVSPTQIWKPDIAVYTASPDTSMFPTVHTNAILFNNGTVLWVPPFTITSRCSGIPFRSAKQLVECNIRMGSWTYSVEMLDLQLGDNKVDLSNFQDSNPDWKLFKVDSDRQVKYYDCCPEGYPAVDFNITLKRRHTDELSRDHYHFPAVSDL